MIPTTFELREVRKPARKIQIEKDTLNLENVSSYKISESIFSSKVTLTVFLKSGEVITYEGMDKANVHALFSKK